MEHILIIGDNRFDIDLFKAKSYEGNIKCYPISRREIQLRDGDKVVKLIAVNSIFNQFTEKERDMIPYKKPKILMMTFTSKDFAYEILKSVDFIDGLYIDEMNEIKKYENVFKR